MELLRDVHILLNIMRSPSSHFLTVVVLYTHEEYIRAALNKTHAFVNSVVSWDRAKSLLLLAFGSLSK